MTLQGQEDGVYENLAEEFELPLSPHLPYHHGDLSYVTLAINTTTVRNLEIVAEAAAQEGAKPELQKALDQLLTLLRGKVSVMHSLNSLLSSFQENLEPTDASFKDDVSILREQIKTYEETLQTHKGSDQD
mmetsp:Transcript_8479/g.14252  ORF Transcript_8479/g.14252 Transcript_8479/m.14252 type:complete len:131 (+) Transcript_8479:492-884(+)